MPRTIRTPPFSAKPEGHDIMITPETYGPSASDNNIARNKRLCPDFSPENEWKSLEDKIMQMLASWRADQDSILNKITSDIIEVKKQTSDIQKTNTEIEKALDFMNSGYEKMRLAVECLEREKLEQRSYILELERKVEDLELSSRSSSIEIRNVPQSAKETTGDLYSLVVQTCNAVEASITPIELRDVYRLPGKKGSNKPIIAEFLNVPTKMKVLNASRTFNRGLPPAEKLNTGHIGISGSLIPVYVSEHLPGSVRQLFYEARNFCKTHKYKFCWVTNGRIFLREREGMDSIAIKSLSCIKKLLRNE